MKDPNLVDWEPNDKDNPRNWSMGFKVWCTFQLSMLAFAASLGSSIIASGEPDISLYTGVSSEVTVLCISLYIVGFAFGPSCWGPISEIWGRRWGMLPAMFCVGLFSIGTATSKNAAAIFVTRFFAGVVGSAPVSNVAAAIGDVWEPKVRGIAVSFYGVCVVGGPTLGPVIGAALVASPGLGWRWTEYLQAIWAFAVTFVTFFALPETYAPVLLKFKARRLRKETGNDALYHPHEHMELNFKTLVTKHLARPIRMLITEPMVSCIALYASFVYALLYLTIEVFPLVFEEIRGWKPVAGSLPFLALFVGVLFGLLVNMVGHYRYRVISEAKGGRPVPEARLPSMIIGGFLFAIGLFWFGWTANPKIFWVAPVLAAVFIGAGFYIIFQQCVNFLIDTYGLYAASAVAANTVLRSILAASFPLVAKPMFHNLGVGLAMSILGAVACIAIPVPFLFMKYGVKLRRVSKFAVAYEG
ncbi:MFS general substrate transporter [Lepidopterella palustris CBS 459.81]|uniref:MFS general substrate transporter n=1 Tax=Lepidopterella palustris CBS 459.81 TaxID=1314670 RepID=A0A8E2E438_9PEZI|nr:MFS general substrate transporter [Lepidopterella palustris CBS 459.81]